MTPVEVADIPGLVHFMGAYMHQDWDIHGADLEGVVGTYARDVGVEAVHGLQADIGMLVFSGEDLDRAYERLFPNGPVHQEWGMDARGWLLKVSEIAAG